MAPGPLSFPLMTERSQPVDSKGGSAPPSVALFTGPPEEKNNESPPAKTGAVVEACGMLAQPLSCSQNSKVTDSSKEKTIEGSEDLVKTAREHKEMTRGKGLSESATNQDEPDSLPCIPGVVEQVMQCSETEESSHGSDPLIPPITPAAPSSHPVTSMKSLSQTNPLPKKGLPIIESDRPPLLLPPASHPSNQPQQRVTQRRVTTPSAHSDLHPGAPGPTQPPPQQFPRQLLSMSFTQPPRPEPLRIIDGGRRAAESERCLDPLMDTVPRPKSTLGIRRDGARQSDVRQESPPLRPSMEDTLTNSVYCVARVTAAAPAPRLVHPDATPPGRWPAHRRFLDRPPPPHLQPSHQNEKRIPRQAQMLIDFARRDSPKLPPESINPVSRVESDRSSRQSDAHSHARRISTDRQRTTTGPSPAVRPQERQRSTSRHEASAVSKAPPLDVSVRLKRADEFERKLFERQRAVKLPDFPRSAPIGHPPDPESSKKQSAPMGVNDRSSKYQKRLDGLKRLSTSEGDFALMITLQNDVMVPAQFWASDSEAVRRQRAEIFVKTWHLKTVLIDGMVDAMRRLVNGKHPSAVKIAKLSEQHRVKLGFIDLIDLV
eukprot:Protomagalhaensia_sp_Gyna_25__753@NODE_1360_length_1910_cov_4_172635_g1092_i0_p1_GENE_NODE_1360_length_1910_cov_4_172635_g1092_i0NODE_1360_length_1910_cov_4_172635_g1092_i0_p1_ORF_typecomplete_len617_score106_63_NODE_1360_length_1910_cov_4_172635_g1092_i0581863